MPLKPSFFYFSQNNWPKNLAVSQKVLTFASQNRDLAQLVAHTSGGREVAGSSPVIPTNARVKCLIFRHLIFFDTVFAQHLRIFVTFVAKSPIVRQYYFSSEQFKSRSSITFPFLVFQSVVLSLDDTVSVTVLDGVLYRVHVI